MAQAKQKTDPPKKASGVVKFMCSLPRGLYNHVVKSSREAGKAEGKRPNRSGFIAKLVFADKFSNNPSPENTKTHV